MINDGVARLTPQEKAALKNEIPTMIGLLQTIDAQYAGQALADFNFTFEEGMQALIASLSSNPPKLGAAAEAWKATRSRQYFDLLIQMYTANAGDPAWVVGALQSRVQAPEQTQILGHDGMAAWVRTKAGSQKITDVFNKITDFLPIYRRSAVVRAWLNADAGALTDAAKKTTAGSGQWITAAWRDGGAPEPLFVACLNGDPFWLNAVRDLANGADKVWLKSDANKLKAVLTKLGPQAGAFLVQLQSTIVDGAKALVDNNAVPGDIYMFINDARFGESDQEQAVRSPVIPWQTVFPGRAMMDVFTKLTAAPKVGELFRDVPTAKTWLKSTPEKLETFLKTNSAAAAQVWAPLLVDENLNAMLLKVAQGSEAAWAASLQSSGKYIPFMNADPKQGGIGQNSTEERSIWAMWTGGLPEKLALFRKLYRSNLAMGVGYAQFEKTIMWGTPPRPFKWQARYSKLVPNETHLLQMMQMFQRLPRSHVDQQGTICFGNGAYEYRNEEAKQDPATGAVTMQWGAWSGQNTGTSFYDSQTNTVVLNVGDAGALTGGPGWTVDASSRSGPAAGFVPGAAGAGMAGTTPGTPGQALTYFQNHAAHEAGHAVGAKTLQFQPRPDGTPNPHAGWNGKSGDGEIKSRFGWADGSRADIEALFTAADAPAATPNRIPAAQASAFLADIAMSVNPPRLGPPPADWNSAPAAPGGGGGALPPTVAPGGTAGSGPPPPAPAGPGGPPAMPKPWTIDDMYRLVQAQYPGTKLFQYVQATGGKTHGTGYQFPGYEPNDPVVFAHGGSVKKYNKTLWQNRGSLSWYGLSTHAECFAEMYTIRYGMGGSFPGTEDLFTALNDATNADFLPPTGTAAPMPGAAPGGGATNSQQPPDIHAEIQQVLRRWP